MIAVALLAATAACSPLGDWEGSLTVPSGVQLPLVLHLRTEGSTLDSPAQNVKDIPAELAASDRGARVVVASIGVVFEGTLSSDCAVLAGPFRQGGVKLKASFHRRQAGATVDQTRERPQAPKPPFPYAATDIVVPNGDVTLAGTLTMPKGRGPFPAVVMIAGSGPQDRDEVVAGHRIFLVIADRLTREGIAVLRYDKRGVGRSTGSFATATQRDFTADATAALDWLRRQPGIDAARVGLLGHSEGAEIAPAVADGDGHVAFAILLSAGRSLIGHSHPLRRNERASRSSGGGSALLAERHVQGSGHEPPADLSHPRVYVENQVGGHHEECVRSRGVERLARAFLQRDGRSVGPV